MTPAKLPLRAYMLATRALHPLAPLLLRRRLKRGKEMPGRWREKLGHATLPRPHGTLIWLHAVGLGETLALRGLVDQMAQLSPDEHFLITSGTRASAEVLERNMPNRTLHQFLPIDTPGYARRFLDHWQPDLAIWAEQEVWPGLVFQTDQRGIPLAMVNARLDEAAFTARSKARGVYSDILGRFALLSAQDAASAVHLEQLGAADVRVDGSLKPAAPALTATAEDLERLRIITADSKVFLVASSHAEDEREAHRVAVTLPRDWVTVIVPREPERASGLLQQWGDDACPLDAANTAARIIVDGRFGTLGAWYRLAEIALIGGSFGPVEGHNPWEAATLGAAIVSGPRTANFAIDYKMLREANACYAATDADSLRSAVLAEDHKTRADAAQDITQRQAARIATLAQDVTALLRTAR
ncbi:3-deoxy-D-manno-octulosonic acid transferase [Aliishimia ponticola]|uniref:3-deoxy-D-manno-octulosonic acid transferase n=1 Tax=Aliishimia ponticola TaxID=2499833 RepID=A0A4S4NF08_9RHOB|nr:glycosyltransferase N-terminal domain-containing protein [Aliishimia ponticola]THH36728.1 3-deoxy-D-manno-octulosonic acid transferase [Aliishimia ponticola]